MKYNKVEPVIDSDVVPYDSLYFVASFGSLKSSALTYVVVSFTAHNSRKGFVVGSSSLANQENNVDKKETDKRFP